MTGLPQTVREIRRALAWHRGWIAAGLAAATVALGLSALAPDPPPRVRVLAAARDLRGGVALAADDLTAVALPPGAAPAGALRPGAAVLGRLTAGPMRRGEPLTDVRLMGPGLLAAYGAGVVAAPVRIADPGAVALLRAGDRVDVLAAATSAGPAGAGGPAVTVAADVAVLSVPPAAADGPIADGALVVLATTPAVAARLAAAAVTDRLSVIVRGAGS